MTEHDEQVAFIQWCKLNEARYPGLDLIFAIPNGGKRHPVVAMKLKAEGVRPGVPDLCLPVARQGFHGLYIEMKDKRGHVSPEQDEKIIRLCAEGYRAVVCMGWIVASMIISQYYSGDCSGTNWPSLDSDPQRTETPIAHVCIESKP
jgi:hypothetical protein